MFDFSMSRPSPVITSIVHAHPLACSPRGADKAKTISIHSTKLNGLIPIELSQLTRLSQLALFGDKLSGYLSPEIIKMKVRHGRRLLGVGHGINAYLDPSIDENIRILISS